LRKASHSLVNLLWDLILKYYHSGDDDQRQVIFATNQIDHGACLKVWWEHVVI
jgi:hypothetical protein